MYNSQKKQNIRSNFRLTDLDAALKDVSGDGEAFLPVDRFAEDHQLLEQKDASLFRPRQEAAVLLDDREGVLLEQFAQSRDLSLE